MVKGRTNTLGTVLPDVEDVFFARILRGITDVGRAEGFEVLVGAHRRIAMIAGAPAGGGSDGADGVRTGSGTSGERIAGYGQALADAGIAWRQEFVGTGPCGARTPRPSPSTCSPCPSR